MAPPLPGAPCRAAEPGGYTEKVRQILKAGFGPGQAALQAAERHYNAAIRMSPADPRGRQAWTLLLKQLKYKEALEEFRVAVQQPGALCAQGWESLIRVESRSQQYLDVLRSLAGYANAVNNSDRLLNDQMSKEDSPSGSAHDAYVQTVRPSRQT